MSGGERRAHAPGRRRSGVTLVRRAGARETRAASVLVYQRRVGLFSQFPAPRMP